ncbi:MAG: S8 family serine peptidase [Verrucomicrobiota bacterium]
MSFARNFVLCLLLTLAFAGSAFAAATNSLVWQMPAGRVSADVHGQALWPLLEDIAHQTGWHIFVEPGADRKSDVKFSDLPAGEALKKLLGDLNFALVPRTNEASRLYVFTTRMENATRPVAVPAVVKPAPQRHSTNELILKVKPGTDIDALAKSLGAKVIGRSDKLGLYKLEFADAAATESALGKLKANPDVAQVDYNYFFDPPVGAQRLANAPLPPVSLTLNPPGDSGRVIVGLVDTAIQSLGSELDPFILKQVSVVGDAAGTGTEPTHATSMAETILRAMALAAGGSTAAQILPVNVYGASESTSSWNVALGIQAAVDGGATVLNLSLSGTTESAILSDIIQSAIAKGIVVFAAAGNQPVSAPTYPAAISGVVAVAATQDGSFAPYSNFGSFISLALPGASVVYLGGQAWVVQGTSPATAYATGVAAGTRSGTSMTWAQILAAMQAKFPVPAK